VSVHGTKVFFADETTRGRNVTDYLIISSIYLRGRIRFRPVKFNFTPSAVPLRAYIAEGDIHLESGGRVKKKVSSGAVG